MKKTIALIYLMIVLGSSVSLSKIPSYSESIDEWPMFHHDLSHTGYSTSSSPTTNNILWSRPLGALLPSLRGSTSTAVAQGRVYVGSFEGDVFCLSVSTGDVIWSYKTGGSISSCPAVDEGKVYISSSDGYIYCFDSDKGSLLWKYKTNGIIESSPSVAYGQVYVGSRDGNLYCLDASGGTKIWSYYTGEIFLSSPAIFNDRIYIIGRYVFCLNAHTGTLIWSDTTYTDGNASPVIANGFVYIGFSRPGWGRVDCLDASTGSRIWSFTPGAAVCSTPAVMDGKIYFGSCDDNLYCLDAITGTKIWSYFAHSYEIRSSPAVANGLVYFVDENEDNLNGKVYCLDASTGSPVWEYVTGSRGGWSSPAIAYGSVFICAGNTMYAFGPRAHALEVKWVRSQKWRRPGQNLVVKAKVLKDGSPMTAGTVTAYIYATAIGKDYVLVKTTAMTHIGGGRWETTYEIPAPSDSLGFQGTYRCDIVAEWGATTAEKYIEKTFVFNAKKASTAAKFIKAESPSTVGINTLFPITVTLQNPSTKAQRLEVRLILPFGMIRVTGPATQTVTIPPKKTRTLSWTLKSMTTANKIVKIKVMKGETIKAKLFWYIRDPFARHDAMKSYTMPRAHPE